MASAVSVASSSSLQFPGGEALAAGPPPHASLPAALELLQAVDPPCAPGGTQGQGPRSGLHVPVAHPALSCLGAGPCSAGSPGPCTAQRSSIDGSATARPSASSWARPRTCLQAAWRSLRGTNTVAQGTRSFRGSGGQTHKLGHPHPYETYWPVPVGEALINALMKALGLVPFHR